MTIPVFIPHLGCGHDCVFCDQRAISGEARHKVWTRQELIRHIDAWLLSSGAKDHIEIGFFGGSFTGMTWELQERCLSVAKVYKDAGRIQGIRLSTRPDYMDEAMAQKLKGFGVTLVEFGVQSFDADVLSQSKRGHGVEAINRAVAAMKAAELPFGIQLMMGLPGDTAERFLDGVRRTIDLKPACVRLYPTLVLASTELADMARRGTYKALALEEAVLLAAEAYQMFLAASIPVIRMGLQASEGLSSEGGVIDGPHHDAFRTLVESELYRRLMERDLVKGLAGTRLRVRVHPKHVSFISGHQRANLLWLADRGVRLTKIIGDPTLEPYEIKWEAEA